MADVDVIVVGGGIAGSSLAYALASAGREVAVLEASTEFEDRVRGEQMHAWGVAEARDLGVEQVLLDAGAHVTTVWRQYAEGAPEPSELPVSMMVPGIPGTLNLRHPDACQALLNAAAGAGSRVERGVSDVKVARNGAMTVTYQHDGRSHTLRAPLVVGADGRTSTVRRQAGIELNRDEPVNYIAGLLLDDLEVPDDHDAIVSEGDLFLVLFHQGHGRARTYLVVGKSGQHRFSGREAIQRFTETLRIRTFPWAEQLAAGTPAGPCATYPGDDTWTDHPYGDGVVLVGDSAGWNDPIIGEGLSISMRDARMVRDLILEGARQPADFAPYGQERDDRMRRLRLLADVVSVTFSEDAENRAARRAWVGERMAMMDPEVFTYFAAILAGPETLPAELVDLSILEKIRAA
ncbi:MAG TPA: NAD(P)/FAD-dependent oxidoreductase [Acidimicrobiales bacterium]|nr:NAD(P)/FAD-dependent oxidoreductase [Acidimicrobiales bacterium]